MLTEERNFGGSLDDLREAHAACRLPLLRKDFIVDPYQLAEAASAGAAAVLLIVAALDRPQLAALHATPASAGLDVLVEVHDRAELDVALALGAGDRRASTTATCATSASTSSAPSGCSTRSRRGALVVAESGIATAAQLDAAAASTACTRRWSASG